MDSDQGGGEVPLLAAAAAAANGDRSPKDLRSPSTNHSRDVHILSFSFLFLFCAYEASQNLQSTVNAEGNLGPTSMGILYLSMTLFSIVASLVVGHLGSKRALLLGATGFLLFIASNLKPSWYTMVPASVYLGFTASIIWVGQGTYLTTTARSQAKDGCLPLGTTIGRFNGEFWGVFASTQIVGNLLTLALLKNGEDGESVDGRTMLFAVFLACILLGIFLMFFLSIRDDKEESVAVHPSFGSILKSVISPLFELRMQMIIPLLAYAGLQQSFVWAEFTKHVVKPAIGVSGVGAAMAVYGAADATCSLTAGRLTTGLSSITVIICGGALLETIVLLWFLFGAYSASTGTLGYAYLLSIAAIWGIGNGVFNTQLNSLIGILFKQETEAAFAQLKVWQSTSIAAVFFVSPHISFRAMVAALLAVLCVAISGFLFLALRVERRPANPDTPPAQLSSASDDC